VTNNITINAFGKESLDHISAQFLDQRVRRTDKGLVELIEKIHFDPGHQQNCNLKITNMRLPIMQIHNGTTWKYDRKERILNELVDKGHGMMQEHFDDHEDSIKEQLSETMFDHIRK
jgi:mannose/cellobiose epimerase-like protein (N-acyl-D-glucosamine 2-epimerase family)